MRFQAKTYAEASLYYCLSDILITVNTQGKKQTTPALKCIKSKSRDQFRKYTTSIYMCDTIVFQSLY